jgi:pre-mRNA-splicing factor ATP-dependent RNA helicase DHX15/PRP43
MADRRPEEPEAYRAKRARTGDMDPSTNPYLAHMYEVEQPSNGYSNGNGSSKNSGLSHLKRHQTTALQAHAAEDGPNNPFNNVPLSSRYFNILTTRRDLPVHKQRRVTPKPSSYFITNS